MMGELNLDGTTNHQGALPDRYTGKKRKFQRIDRAFSKCKGRPQW